MKFFMRPADAADARGVSDIVHARSAWLEARGMPSWRESAEDIAVQTENSDGAMWILEADGKPAGCTTVTETTPPMAWTPQELGESSLYLYTTITDPVFRAWRPGTLIACWAVDRAARESKLWVRRGCRFARLARYYETQGFAVVHETQRTHGPMYLMERRAEVLPDLEYLFSVGMATPRP